MNINEFIKDADMILVGIGEEFQEKFENMEVLDEKNFSILEDYKKRKYLNACEENEVNQAYASLEKLLTQPFVILRVRVNVRSPKLTDKIIIDVKANTST